MGALWFFLLARAAPTLAAERAAPPPPPPSANVILYLVPSRPGALDSRALVEAVGIYTRDLQLTVEAAVSDELASPGPAAVPRLTALLRSRGARLAFGCIPAADGRSVELVSVDARGTVRDDVVPLSPSQGPDFHRAVALKLRAILTPWTGTPPRVEPAPAAIAVAKPSGGATPPPGPMGGREPAQRTSEEPPVPGSGPVLAGTVEYGVSRAPGPGSNRQAVGVEIAGSGGPSAALEIFAGAQVARPADRAVAAGSVALSDIPVRLGGRWVDRRRGWVLALGLFGSVHLLSASASSAAGARAETSTAAGGGGAEVVARSSAFGRLAWQARAWVEGIVPNTRFFVGGSRAIETGRYVIGLGLGLNLATR